MIALQMITGQSVNANAYTNHTTVLVKTIKSIVRLRSPALLVCQVLYTCGINVMQLKKLPRYPTKSM